MRIRRIFWALALAACASRGMTISGTAERVVAPDGVALTTYRLREEGRDQKWRGILFYLQGSSTEPVKERIGTLAGAVTMDMLVVLAERRQDAEHDTKPVRVADQRAVIDHYLREFSPGLPVVLMGESEGGDVACAVAARDPRITHLVLIGCGGGWTQARELEHFARGDEARLAELRREFERIRAAPDAMADWLGHPYRRWSSYLWSAPADDLRGLSIPIFLAQGDADQSVPVESARALAEEFARLGKSNLTYREYAGVDHHLREVSTGRHAQPLLECDLIAWFERQGLVTPAERARFEDRVHRSHPEWFGRG